MSIFNRLFKKKAVLLLDDPVFGKMTFDHGIWSSSPSSLGEEFVAGAVVDAPESGPTDEQRAFYERIRGRLADFEEKAREFIRAEASDHVEVAILSTYAVVIGDSEETEAGRFTLELSDPNAWVIHRVEFCGDRPLLYGYDD